MKGESVVQSFPSTWEALWKPKLFSNTRKTVMDLQHFNKENRQAYKDLERNIKTLMKN